MERLGFEVNAEGQTLDYIKRAASIRDNHPTPVVPADLCDHGIDASRVGLCGICREDAVKKTAKAGQKYKRTGDSSTGEVIELQAVFPLDQSIAFLIVEAPHARYRKGLRGTVSFSDLDKNYTLIPAGSEPDALYWAGRKFLVLGTVGYQHGRAVCLIEDDGRPAAENGVDFSFCIRETDLRNGSWSAHPPRVAEGPAKGQIWECRDQVGRVGEQVRVVTLTDDPDGEIAVEFIVAKAATGYEAELGSDGSMEATEFAQRYKLVP